VRVCVDMEKCPLFLKSGRSIWPEEWIVIKE
jgi:hypothetical protein